jgi:pimeloyl-ACP methyl ester carboxylesterase
MIRLMAAIGPDTRPATATSAWQWLDTNRHRSVARHSLGWDLRGCGGSVPNVDDVGSPPAEPVEAARLTAGVVVQPDALAEQDRCDVEVDLVDQSSSSS